MTGASARRNMVKIEKETAERMLKYKKVKFLTKGECILAKMRYRKECLNRVYKAIKELNKAQELASKDLDDVLATRIDEHRLSLIRIYNKFLRKEWGES